MKCLNMSWVSALLMCQEISMVMATEAYEINKSKTGHPVELVHGELEIKCQSRNLEIRTRVVPVNFIMEVKYNTRSPGMKRNYFVLCK